VKNPQELKDLRPCEGADLERRRAEFGRRLSDWSTWGSRQFNGSGKDDWPLTCAGKVEGGH